MTEPTLPKINVKKFKRHKPKGARKDDPLESTIETQVCKHAKDHGIAHRKYKTVSRAAAPDRIYFPGNGVAFFIEFKRKGKVPTDAQEREHTRLRALGFEVFWTDSIEGGVKIINTWLALNR